MTSIAPIPCPCGGVPTELDYTCDGMLDYLSCPDCGDMYGGMFDWPEFEGLVRSWNHAIRTGEKPKKKKKNE